MVQREGGTEAINRLAAGDRCGRGAIWDAGDGGGRLGHARLHASVWLSRNGQRIVIFDIFESNLKMRKQKHPIWAAFAKLYVI